MCAARIVQGEFYCDKHRLPWCNKSNRPVSYCYCLLCMSDEKPKLLENCNDCQITVLYKYPKYYNVRKEKIGDGKVFSEDMFCKKHVSP